MKDYKGMKMKRGFKFWVCLGASAGISLHLVLRVKDQLKTFSIKLSSDILKKAKTESIDFDGLNYVDVTEQIRKGANKAKPPSVLTYLFNNSNEIPDSVLKEVNININKNELENEVVKFIEEFRAFRWEKNVTKNLKFKAEIIKC